MATETNSTYYMLGCFYTAEENKETYDAIRNLAAAPEGQIAFILGKPSTGKTTILQALADEFRSRGGLSVEILSYDAFKNHLLTAIKAGETAEFYTHFFIKTDHLLLDNSQFLTESISDVIVELAKTYEGCGKTLILAGDHLPESLRIPKLKILPLVRASKTTRKIILKERLQANKMSLEDTVLDKIAEKLEDPRRIIGFATYLAAMQDLKNNVKENTENEPG